MPPKKPPTVMVVSDGRGDTAQQLLDAAAVQFEDMRYRTRRRADVRTVEQVQSVVKEAAKDKAVIFYTLVDEDVRKAMRKNTRERHVASVDILGQAFTALHDLFHQRRGATPGLLYAQERERIDRMDAIDYTLKHDDGQRVDRGPYRGSPFGLRHGERTLPGKRVAVAAHTGRDDGGSGGGVDAALLVQAAALGRRIQFRGTRSSRDVDPRSPGPGRGRRSRRRPRRPGIGRPRCRPRNHPP